MGANRRVIQLSLLLLLLSGSINTAVWAAEPVAPPNSVNMNDLSILEHRFFSHPYAHDPAEKRLERLECLVFGSTREGSNPERLTRLMKIVAARSQQPLAVQDKTAAPATPGVKTDSDQQAAAPPQSSKQYPILNTLEWKALKKTFPAESLDQRLDRLESKMFGQPAQSMAYADRVERLKKTVGIGLTPEATDGITATGPMPKARPRGEESDFEGFGAPQNTNPMNDMMPYGGFGMMPFGNLLGGDSAFGGMQKQMQQMQQLLQQMHNPNNFNNPGNQGGNSKSFSKSWSLEFDPKTNQWLEHDTKRPVPNGNGMGKQVLPSEPSPESGQLKEVPGYADPNSI